MSALSNLLSLSEEEKRAKGVVFTPGEILQQPATWEKTYDDFFAQVTEVRDFLSGAGLGKSAQDPPTVFLIGAGSSDYIGRSLKHLLRKQWQCDTEALPSTDLLTNLDDLALRNKPSLWISFSRSGDSPEGVAVIDQALHSYPQIRHLIITCNRRGNMVEQFSEHPNVFCLVLDDVTNDKGLAMTSSFTNMVIAGQCLAHFEDLSGYRETLQNMIQLGNAFLDTAVDASAQLAAEAYLRVCFLGTGPLNAVARESALKVLELTAGTIHTMAESYLGVRHGPLSALNENTLVVGFLSGSGNAKAYEIDLLEEIQEKSLGRKRVVISLNGDRRLESLADLVVSIDNAGRLLDAYRPAVDVMFGQLLGLFSSLQHGLKPDSPSPSGVISRVVGKVKIHR